MLIFDYWFHAVLKTTNFMQKKKDFGEIKKKKS